MSEWDILIAVGAIAIILGFFLIAFGMMRSARESEARGDKERSTDQETSKRQVKGGGVILIGPIPIVFGTDKKSALVLVILAIILMLLAIIFRR